MGLVIQNVETALEETDIHTQTCVYKKILKRQYLGMKETMTNKQKTEIKESCDLSKFPQ